MLNIENKFLNGYRFIDLFCGIGGFHYALSSFGAECVFASDINEEAKKVYESNFGIRPYGDITQIDVKDIPSHDILCGGFPCQPFSISGRQKGFDDDRGKLFFNIIDIAKWHKPRIIFLENVKNLETHNNRETLKTMLKALNDIGYTAYHKVLNASDYGVPQSRKRLYIIAFRNDLNVEGFEFPDIENEFKTLNNILWRGKITNDYYINRGDIVIDKDSTKKSRSTIRVGQLGLGRQGERIYSPYGQAITISSQSGGVGGRTGMYLINGKVRRLTPRECARLMGFPENHILADSKDKNYKQFGNSVVINVLQKILQQLKNINL